MSSPADLSTALLTEHLRHTPVSLLDDVINSINTIGYKAVDWVEQGLLATPLENLGFLDPASCKGDKGEEDIEEKVRHELENGVHQFETLLEATIDKNFDKMEIFALRSIIAIPDDLKDWIRLRHYEGLNFTIPPDAPTIESITLQRRKFQETQRLHRILQTEAARNAALITQLRSLLSSTSSSSQNPPSRIATKTEPSNTDTSMKDASSDPPYPAFAFLAQKSDLTKSSAATPLSTTTAFALSQLPAMKALLSELRPALHTMSSTQPQARNPNLVEQDGDKSWRLQRLQYIESQTRRLHENVRGLELGPKGEVRDGEWQERGRRVGRAEVENLERVLEIVGNGNREGQAEGQGEEMDES